MDEARQKINENEHQILTERVKSVEDDIAKVCIDQDAQNARVGDFMQSQSEKMQDFMEQVYKRIDSLRSATTTKEGLLGALSARVRVMESRQDIMERLERDSAKERYAMEGVLKHLSEVLERAMPVQTKKDVDALGETVRFNTGRIDGLLQAPGKAALAAQERRKRWRAALIASLATVGATGLVGLLTWLATRGRLP